MVFVWLGRRFQGVQPYFVSGFVIVAWLLCEKGLTSQKGWEEVVCVVPSHTNLVKTNPNSNKINFPVTTQVCLGGRHLVPVA